MCWSSQKTRPWTLDSFPLSLHSQTCLSHKTLQGPFSGIGCLLTLWEEREEKGKTTHNGKCDVFESSYQVNHFQQRLEVPTMGEKPTSATGSSFSRRRLGEFTCQLYQWLLLDLQVLIWGCSLGILPAAFTLSFVSLTWRETLFCLGVYQEH